MIDREAKILAAQCRHYAMCKIDYLGTGICPSGQEKHFVSYYPQGRMDIYRGVADGVVPITDALLDIADTCTLCGLCDIQCHFVTGLRPLKVMVALKDYVAAYREQGKPIARFVDDRIAQRLRELVGSTWVSNDPAVLLTYADDPFPLAGRQMPRYVVLPGSREEVAAVVRLARDEGIPCVVRGNGGSVFGFVFTDGIVLDMNRMRRIDVDPENWSATVEAGVTSFELQKEVHRLGFRVNVAEPAATVCGNIVCTGIFSTWSNAYGTAADNFIDMEFVNMDGCFFRLNDKASPNILAFEHAVCSSPGICTRAVVRLHPRTDDEEGILIPFTDFGAAVLFARDLARRRIGVALAVLGAHYIATFISPTESLAERIKTLLPDVLGIRFVVYAVADRFAREAIRKMAGSVIDAPLLRTLMLGLPRLADHDFVEVVLGLEGRIAPYEILCQPEMQALLEAVLDPAPETVAESVPQDLRSAYVNLYRRPEMTDMVWLNMFRIVSARMSRRKHMFAFLVYVPLDTPEAAREVMAGFARIAEAHGLDHDYGFLTPMDFGKRAVLEYDYYIDHTDEDEKRKIAASMVEIEPWLDRLATLTKGVMWLKYVFSQGCSRKENFLYQSGLE
jgi:hypothetical protein